MGDVLGVLVSSSLYPVSFPLEEFDTCSGSVTEEQVQKCEDKG